MSGHPRLLTLCAALVAVLLFGLAFYPGSLAAPYLTGLDAEQYSIAVVPEGSAAYTDTPEREYAYADLSPVAKTFVDRARAAPDGTYTPTVCQEFLLVCDAYTRDELPDEFVYGDDLYAGESLVAIDDDGDRTLLETGFTGHGFFALPFRLFSAWLTLLPLSVIVGSLAVVSNDERVLAGAIAVGTTVGAVCVFAPYAQLLGFASARGLGFILVGVVWTGIAGACVLFVLRSAFTAGRGGDLRG